MNYNSIQISKSKVFESPHTKRYLNIHIHATSSNPNTTNSEADNKGRPRKKKRKSINVGKNLLPLDLFFYQTTNDVVTLSSRHGRLSGYSFEAKHGSQFGYDADGNLQ